MDQNGNSTANVWEVPSSSSPVAPGPGNEGSYTQHPNYSFPFRDISEFFKLDNLPVYRHFLRYK